VTGAAKAVDELMSKAPFLERGHAERLIRCYGTDARAMLSSATTVEDLGRHFGGTLYEAEVRWLLDREWAVSAEDILWRRTKQGLFLTPDEVAGLEDYLQTATVA
jgi:glycerol-3-phosphate dehydrogenase